MNDKNLPRKSGRQRFAVAVVLSTVFGILVGVMCHRILSPAAANELANYFSVVTTSFLRLISMIIAPLVLATLTSAMARMGGAAEVGRVGAKALVWFVAASCISLTVGLLMAHALEPGATLRHSGLLASSAKAAGASLQLSQPSIEDFVSHLIPRSLVAAMADNEILQVVLFSLFLGTAAASLKEKANRVVELVEQLSDVMFQVTNYVMMLAPLAIFAALAGSISRYGIGIVQTYAEFVGGFYLSLSLLWLAFMVALVMLTRSNALQLVARIRQPVILAFATSSSEAAYPRLLEELVAFGVPRRTAAFVLPLGYSFNLDGAMM
jgi:Na+/H+-dicarboxylate symporter